MINKSGDGVLYQYTDDDQVFEAEIEYSYEEESEESVVYFTTDSGIVYYLNEFMRIDLKY